MSTIVLRVPTGDDLQLLHHRIDAFYADAGSLCYCTVDNDGAKVRTRQLRDTLHAILSTTTTLKDMMLPFRRACAQLSDQHGMPMSSASWHELTFATAYDLLSAVAPHCHADSVTEPPPIDLADPAVQQMLAEFRPRFAGEFKLKLRSRLMTELAAGLNILTEMQGAARIGDETDNGQPIPRRYRTKVMSKQQAATYLGRPNPDSGVKWLNGCIERGELRCESLTKQSHVFDLRQFPSSVQPSLQPIPNSR